MMWYELILVVVCIAFVAAVILYMIFNERDIVMKWLITAVTEAEKELGSGTGQLKLLTVYQMFVDKFTVVSKFITFSTFSKLVDVALETMKNMLNNPNIAVLINKSEIEQKTKVLNE